MPHENSEDPKQRETKIKNIVSSSEYNTSSSDNESEPDPNSELDTSSSDSDIGPNPSSESDSSPESDTNSSDSEMESDSGSEPKFQVYKVKRVKRSYKN